MRASTRSSTDDGTWIGASRWTQRKQARILAGVEIGDQHAALDQHVEQLLDEERVAAGARGDLGDEIVDIVAGHEPRDQHLAPRGVVELLEHHDLGAELLRHLQDPRIGARRHQAEQRARRLDLEQRAEQLLRILIGPVNVLADQHDRLVALELALDPDQHLHQGLALRLGVDRLLIRGREVARTEQHAEELERGARLGAVLFAREDQRRARATTGARPRAARHPRRGRARRARDPRSRRTESSRCRPARVVRITTASPGEIPSRNVRTSVRLPTPASPTITSWRLRLVTSTSRHASRSAFSSIARPCSRLFGAALCSSRIRCARSFGPRSRNTRARLTPGSVSSSTTCGLLAAVPPGASSGRSIAGERLERPLAARRAKHAAADEDLGATRLARELVRERRGRFFDLERQRLFLAGGRPRRLDERDAALDREREPELGIDVRADAVERVDQRERELDRAIRVVLARDRQADDDAQTVRRASAPAGSGPRARP